MLVIDGTLVLGFFDGDTVEPFEHKVTRAYRWPPDAVGELLARAGFVEVERQQRQADGPRRAYAVLVARAE